jgi:hypothetical protein
MKHEQSAVFPKPVIVSQTTEGRIEAVKILFDFSKYKEWKRQLYGKNKKSKK